MKSLSGLVIPGAARIRQTGKTSIILIAGGVSDMATEDVKCSAGLLHSVLQHGDGLAFSMGTNGSP